MIPQPLLIGFREPICLELQADGTCNTVSPGWNSLVRRFQLEDLSAERFLGSSFHEHLSPDAARAWQGFQQDADGGSRPNPPRMLTEHLFPWPLNGNPSSLALELRPSSVEALCSDLELPMFTRLDAVNVGAFNGRARRFLEVRPELRQVSQLETWLGRQSQCFELRVLPAFSPWGRELLFPRLKSLHGDSSFRLLTRILRSALHDLSNPIAAVRMVSEVAGRGFGDPSKHLAGMGKHLDTVTSLLKSLRRLSQMDASCQSFDALAILDMAKGLIRSELDRRGVELDLSAVAAPEPELEGSANDFLWLSAGLLLMLVSEAVDGDRLSLISSLDDDFWTLEGRIRPGGGERALMPDPHIRSSTLLALAEPWGATFSVPEEDWVLFRVAVPV